MISAERLAYLDAHYPEAVAYVRPLARRILDAAREAVASSDAELSAALGDLQPDRDAA